MSVEKRVAAYLELATKDVEAAELLMAGGNRYAAYQMQQAIEKLAKALLLAKGIEAGTEHRLEELLKRFAADDPWPARLQPLAS
jgi:HEPN domain-containing protein